MPSEPKKSQPRQKKTSLPVSNNSTTGPSSASSRVGLILPLGRAKSSPPTPKKQKSSAAAAPKRRTSTGWLRKLSSPTSPTATSKAATKKTAFTPDRSLLDPAKFSPHRLPELMKADDESELSEMDSLKLPASVPSPSQPSSLPSEQGFDLDDLHRTQQSLIRLQSEFKIGKLKVFESSEAMNRMKQVREKQESLAKLHFGLHAAHPAAELHTPASRTSSLSNLKQLMTGLQSLKESIQNISKEIGGATSNIS